MFLNNLLSIARVSGNTTFNTSLSKSEPISLGTAAILGGASLLGGITSGLFGSHSQSSANRMNYRIWQEQKQFNAEQARLQREWQERMMLLYGSSSAKANNLRAAGLNAKLGDTSMSSIGQGASASSPSAPVMQSYNAGADIAQGINNSASFFLEGYKAYTDRLAQQSQQSVNDTLVSLNKMRVDTEALIQKSQKLDYKIGQQTLQQMEANTKFLQDTLSSRIRQQYTLESISEWQRQDVKYNALTQQYRLFNLEPARVQETLTNIAYNSAAAFNQFAQGKLNYEQFINYPKEIAIRQTMAQASMLQGRAAMLNAVNYGALLHSQTKNQDLLNEQTQFYNNFWLGKVNTDDAVKYIKRDIPIYTLYKTNLETTKQTFLNLTYQPKLIESLTRANNASAVRNEWGKYDDMVRSVTDMIGTGVDAYTKGASSTLRHKEFDHKVKMDNRTTYHHSSGNGSWSQWSE